jgi:hypothetical protein
MADFLRRLADRAFGLTPIVEARPGLDTSRWWGMADAEPDGSVDEPARVEQLRQVSPPRDVRRGRRLPNTFPGFDEGPESHLVSGPNDKSDAPLRRSPRGPSARSASLDARPREYGVPTPQPFREMRPPPDASTEAIHAARGPANAPDAPRASPTLEPRAAHSDERGAALTPTRTSVMPSDRGIEVTPAPARRAASPSVSQPTPAAVHVTIGRLEVRALTAAPPTTPRAAAQRPQLTLAEYLARRDQASR